MAYNKDIAATLRKAAAGSGTGSAGRVGAPGAGVARSRPGVGAVNPSPGAGIGALAGAASTLNRLATRPGQGAGGPLASALTAGGTVTGNPGFGVDRLPAPAPATGIEAAIADLRGKLGGAASTLGGQGAGGAPALGTRTGVSAVGPATAAVQARLLPRYQAAIASGAMTPEGAANRQSLYQAGALPRQAGGEDPTMGRGRLPVDQATGLQGGEMESVTGGGLRVPGGGSAGLQPLPISTYGAEGGGGGAGTGGMSYATGGGLQAGGSAAGPLGIDYSGINPGPDGRGGNYGAPTFAPQFQNPNFRQMYQDLLQARMQSARPGGMGGNVGSPNLVQR